MFTYEARRTIGSRDPNRRRIKGQRYPLGAAALFAIGGPAAALFTVLHGAGNGILTIAKGTLTVAIFGPAGYGLRQVILGAPSRLLQAAAPLPFGLVIDRYGSVPALAISTSVSVSAFAALLALKAGGPPAAAPAKAGRR